MPPTSNERVARLRETRTAKHWHRASIILSPSASDALKNLLAAGYADSQSGVLLRAIKEAALSDADVPQKGASRQDQLARLNSLLAGYPTQVAFCQTTGVRPEVLSRALKAGRVGKAMADKVAKAFPLAKEGQETGVAKKNKARTRKVVDVSLSPANLRILKALCRHTPDQTRGEIVSQLLIAASDAIGPVKTPVAKLRLKALQALRTRYKTQQDLAVALQIYPERLTRILTGGSGIGRVLGKRIATLTDCVDDRRAGG